jgi:hypothetical protein
MHPVQHSTVYSLAGLDLVASVMQTIVQLVLYVHFKFGPGQYQM